VAARDCVCATVCVPLCVCHCGWQRATALHLWAPCRGPAARGSLAERRAASPRRRVLVPPSWLALLETLSLYILLPSQVGPQPRAGNPFPHSRAGAPKRQSGQSSRVLSSSGQLLSRSRSHAEERVPRTPRLALQGRSVWELGNVAPLPLMLCVAYGAAPLRAKPRWPSPLRFPLRPHRLARSVPSHLRSTLAHPC
jgi:hypothetical protein